MISLDIGDPSGAQEKLAVGLVVVVGMAVAWNFLHIFVLS